MPHCTPEDYLESCAEDLKNNRYEQAARSYFRFCARVRQDISCCNDPSTQSALDLGKMKFLNLFRGHENHMVKYLTKEIQFSVLNDVLEDTETDQLEDPTWIGEYGLMQFLRKRDDMKPKDSWKNTRLNFIRETVYQYHV